MAGTLGPEWVSQQCEVKSHIDVFHLGSHKCRTRDLQALSGGAHYLRGGFEFLRNGV